MCACRLCVLPAELLHEVAVLLVACDDASAPEHLAATCSVHLAPIFRSSIEKGHICREIFDMEAIIRRASWLATSCPEEDVAEVNRRIRPQELGELLEAILTYVRTPIVDCLPLDHPDVDTAIMGIYALLLMDDGKTREMLDQWHTYSFVMAYVRKRLSLDEVTEPLPWPEQDEVILSALSAAWILTTPERLAAEPPLERERLRRGLLPYILMAFRYPAGELPAECFYPPVADGPQGLPHSDFVTAHGTYPIYPRTHQPILGLQSPFPTTPNVWPYAGRDFDFSHPLISSVAKLHYFVRQELGELQVPDHLAEDYPSRREAYRRRVQAEGIDRVGPFEVALTKEDIRKFNLHRGTPPPRRQPNRMTSMQWDADTMRCLMSSSLVGCALPFLLYLLYPHHHCAVESDAPPSALCDSIRMGNMYEPGTMNGLWRGRMLLPQLRFLQHALHQARRTPSFDAHMSDLVINFSAFRIREFVAGIADGARLPARNDARTGWVPYQTSMAVSEDGKECVVSTGTDRRYVYRAVEEHQRMFEAEGGACRAQCAGCQLRERLGKGTEEVDKVFESVGLGLVDTECEECGEHRPRPSKEFLYAFGTPVRETFGMQPQGEGGPEGEDDEDADEGPCADCQRRVFPPTQLKACNHVSSVLLHGTVDEADAAAMYDYELYGRVRPCDGMVGLLRFPKRDSRFAPPGISLAYYTFFYGYVIGGQNFVGTWRIVFPRGVIGQVVLGQDGAGMGGAAGAASEIFWEGPFTMQKVPE
ncbi:hypothetical protein HDZ31DRAFT_30091 [Schizophyllum fasciatum]